MGLRLLVAGLLFVLVPLFPRTVTTFRSARRSCLDSFIFLKQHTSDYRHSREHGIRLRRHHPPRGRRLLHH